MRDPKQQFLDREFLTNAILGAFQHNPVYADGTQENQRAKFRETLESELRSLSQKYKYAVTEEQHLQHITNLAQKLTDSYREILKDGSFRIGAAQKALNLYLKYLWCVGQIKEPPHCPIDAQILENSRKLKGKSWTKLSTIEEYKEWVEDLRQTAASKSLAQWELENWKA
jgi:hypothetical protein